MKPTRANRYLGGVDREVDSVEVKQKRIDIGDLKIETTMGSDCLMTERNPTLNTSGWFDDLGKRQYICDF